MLLFSKVPPARGVFIKVRRSAQKANLRSPAFDVQLFLDSAGLGRSVRKFPGKETIFAQGELGPVGGQNFIHGFTASIALFEE